jgi:hypothetical protein
VIEALEWVFAELVYLGWRLVDMLWPGVLDRLLPDPWGAV